MKQTQIIWLIIALIVPFGAFAQTAGRSGQVRSNKADKPARPGFYFDLWLSEADSYAGWEDEAVKLLLSGGIPAFYGGATSYKGIMFESFIPMRALSVIKNPRDYKSVWVGPFGTEEAAIGELAKFGGVLRPILQKIKKERAELKYNHAFKDFETWSIGAIKISGSELEKPNSKSDEAAAARDWN